MSTVYVILINVILLFIAYLALNHKINKNSTSALLDRYAREVENLIVELNRTLEDVLNLSEERVSELKKLIKKAEKTLLSERSMPGIPPPRDSGAPVSSAGGEATTPAGPTVRLSEGERRTKGAGGKTAGKAAASTKTGALSSAGAAAAVEDTSRSTPVRLEENEGGQTGKGGLRASVQAPSLPLYDMRGKKVDVTTPSTVEERRESPRTANIFERTRHLLSMGHSKDEIAKMLNLSRAEMDFLASLHNK